MQKDTIKKILTEAELNHVVSFVENETQFNAVRKLLSASMKDERNRLVRELEVKFERGEVSNEEAGAQLRARAEGIRRVENGFRDFALFKVQQPKELKVHPGRPQ